MSDLVERLRNHGENAVSYPFHKSRELSRKAANTIEAQAAEIERMRAALHRLAHDSHGYADDKSGVAHMARIAQAALGGEDD